jgi:hypothetical protein
MATSAQMMAAGLALVVDTFLLIYSAFIGDKVFQPLLKWYYSFQYSSPPVIDPGIITWVFPVYYGMLVCMWFALLFVLYWVTVNRTIYQYEV